MSVRHGSTNQPEFTLCGFAFDAHDSGDADEPIIFAKRGEVVTCEECRAVIDYIRQHYRGGSYRFLGEKA